VALGERGLRVPRDVSVVAFDDVEWMSMVDPPLTTIQQPVRDMARGAAELVLRRLSEGSAETPTTMVFHTQLVERGSVAPVRRGRAAKAASAR
jgi:LacI family transcriptional regulator